MLECEDDLQSLMLVTQNLSDEDGHDDDEPEIKYTPSLVQSLGSPQEVKKFEKETESIEIDLGEFEGKEEIDSEPEEDAVTLIFTENCEPSQDPLDHGAATEANDIELTRSGRPKRKIISRKFFDDDDDDSNNSDREWDGSSASRRKRRATGRGKIAKGQKSPNQQKKSSPQSTKKSKQKNKKPEVTDTDGESQCNEKERTKTARKRKPKPAESSTESPQKKKPARKKVSEMTPEEVQANRAKWREERNRRKELGTIKKVKRKKVSEMTPEELEENRKKWREEARRRRLTKLGIPPKEEEESGAEEKTNPNFVPKLSAKRKPVTALSPEELELIREKRRDERRRQRAGMSDKERDAYRKKIRERKRELRAMRTPEQIQEEKQRALLNKLERQVRMTDEEKEFHEMTQYIKQQTRRESAREWHQNKRAKMSEEEMQRRREKLRLYRKNMTPEQRTRFLSRLREGARKRMQKIKEDPEKLAEQKRKWKEERLRKQRMTGRTRATARRRKDESDEDYRKRLTEQRRNDSRRWRLRRQMKIRELINSGMSMEEVAIHLETPEQRERRLIRHRINRAKRSAKQKLMAAGATPEQIEQKLKEIAENYEPSKQYRPFRLRPQTLESLNPSKVESLNVTPPTKTEPESSTSELDLLLEGHQTQQQNQSNSPIIAILPQLPKVKQLDGAITTMSPTNHEVITAVIEPPTPQNLQATTTFLIMAPSTAQPILTQLANSASSSNIISTTGPDGSVQRTHFLQLHQTTTLNVNSLDQQTFSLPLHSIINTLNNFQVDPLEEQTEVATVTPTQVLPPNSTQTYNVTQIIQQPLETCDFATTSTSTFQCDNFSTPLQSPGHVTEVHEIGIAPVIPKEETPQFILPDSTPPKFLLPPQFESPVKKSSKTPSPGRKWLAQRGVPRGAYKYANSTDPNVIPCEVCGNSYKRSYMNEHKQQMHNPHFQNSTCLLCGQTFRKSRKFRIHYNNVHLDKARPNERSGVPRGNITSASKKGHDPETHVICNFCGNWYNKSYIGQHKQTLHHPHFKDFSCTLCGQKFPGGREFYSHYQKVHPKQGGSKGLGSNLCSECGACFKSPYYLRKHIFYNHGEGQNKQAHHQCPLCPSRFKEWGSYLDHIRKKHPEHNTHPCGRCSKGFNRTLDLRSHCISEHPDSYYPCEFCKRLCHTKEGLAFHYVKCLKRNKDRAEQLRKELGEDVIKIEKIRIQCEFCDRKLILSSITRHYEDMHKAKEQNFQCLTCGQKFKRRLYWVAHMVDFHDKPMNEEMKEQARKANLTEEDRLEIVNIGGKHGGVKLAAEGEPTEIKRRRRKQRKTSAMDSEVDSGDGGKKAECEFCRKELLLGSLEAHFYIVHGIQEDNWFECPKCEKRIKRRDLYVKHLINNHGMEWNEEMANSVGKVSVKCREGMDVKNEKIRKRGKITTKRKKIGNRKGRRRTKKVEVEDDDDAESEEEIDEESEDEEKKTKARATRTSMRRKASSRNIMNTGDLEPLPVVKVENVVEDDKVLVIEVEKLSEEEISAYVNVEKKILPPEEDEEETEATVTEFFIPFASEEVVVQPEPD